MPHLTYTSTAEAHQEKEKAKRKAAERAEQRKKKKAILEQKAAERELAGSKNMRMGKSIVFRFDSALYMVLTVGYNYQNKLASLFKNKTSLLAAIPK